MGEASSPGDLLEDADPCDRKESRASLDGRCVGVEVGRLGLESVAARLTNFGR